MDEVLIRAYDGGDAAALRAMLAPVLSAGDTYALPTDWPSAAALAYWTQASHRVFVAEVGGEVVGTYYLKANQQGPGDHVCNCGYVTSPAAQGRGVARAMCQHSQVEARRAGFRAMQFNCVVVTNTRAVELWQRLGYAIVGRLPGAFRHPRAGFVDALVMFKAL